jgi:hypothetical protein
MSYFNFSVAGVFNVVLFDMFWHMTTMAQVSSLPRRARLPSCDKGSLCDYPRYHACAGVSQICRLYACGLTHSRQKWTLVGFCQWKESTDELIGRQRPIACWLVTVGSLTEIGNIDSLIKTAMVRSFVWKRMEVLISSSDSVKNVSTINLHPSFLDSFSLRNQSLVTLLSLSQLSLHSVFMKLWWSYEREYAGSWRWGRGSYRDVEHWSWSLRSPSFGPEVDLKAVRAVLRSRVLIIANSKVGGLTVVSNINKWLWKGNPLKLSLG